MASRRQRIRQWPVQGAGLEAQRHAARTGSPAARCQDWRKGAKDITYLGVCLSEYRVDMVGNGGCRETATLS